MTPGQRIHAAWTRSGMIQADFAAALSVSRVTLRSWMRNPDTDKSARTPPPIYVREAERIAQKCTDQGEGRDVGLQAFASGAPFR